ncbi:MAG TPA: hypothetical protein VKB58_05245, partial [Terriglobales bacterium]|nr:hypothetical protein [Terriglobales bacterium]
SSGNQARGPDTALWAFTAGATPIAGVTISNAAYPGKVLQPAGNSSNSGADVVLGDPAVTHVVVQVKNPWHMSSPSLGASQFASHA